jgi:predicted aspartyl protease
MAPVMLNGQGPFRFVVDTGASRSVVSPTLVERLGLAQATDTRITIQGATGTEAVPSVLIERLQAGDIVMENVRLPVVGLAVLAGADGILGVEGFDKMRIVVDFTADSISITRARMSWMSRRGWYRVPVRLRFGRLMVAQARIGDLAVKAVIDTGAERTLGNLALRDALGLGTAEHLERAQSKVIGATSNTESALTLPSPVIVFGQTTITGVDVTFGDLHVFRIWDLEHEPALVIGMDVLGTPQALMFDYRNEELQLRTGAPGKRGG